MVVVSTGSMSATSGIMVLLTMAIFTDRPVSVMMENCETSAALPEVVGRQIRGGPGSGTLSTPSKERTCAPLAWATPMALAQSMGLPPPTATMASQPSAA